MPRQVRIDYPGAYITRICLREGVYSGALNRNLSTGTYMSGKKFYVKGINGKSRVTIDCGGLGRFLKIETPMFNGSCGIEGVTIRNGYVSDNGGAILVTSTSYSAQPFIARCTIAGCHANSEGGAICVQSGSLLVYECELFANDAAKGGAVSIGTSVAYYFAVYGIRCTLAYNSADIGGGNYSRGHTRWKDGAIFRNTARQGGGVVIDAPTITGTYSTFSTVINASFKTAIGFPTATSFFNGRFNPSVMPPLNGCRLSENNAWSATNPGNVRGGAIVFTDAREPIIESLVLERNRSAGTGVADGGGVWNINSSPILYGCLFRGNETTGSGGAFGAASSYSNAEYITLSNCALCDNSAAIDGGAISALPIYQGSGPQVYSGFQVDDCTLTFNRSTSRVIDLPASSIIELRRSIVCYNTTDPGGLKAGISVHPGSSFTDNYLDDTTLPPGTAPPVFAWDNFHLINESAPKGPGISGSYLDIEFESRSANTPRYTGCDQWTDTDGDGIPDWYAKLIVDLSPNDAVTLSTVNLGALPMWGSSGPAVFQMAALGWDPNIAPSSGDLNGDADGDGLTNGQEFALGSNPNNPDSDNDLSPDGEEIDKETDPLDDASTPQVLAAAGAWMYDNMIFDHYNANGEYEEEEDHRWWTFGSVETGPGTSAQFHQFPPGTWPVPYSDEDPNFDLWDELITPALPTIMPLWASEYKAPNSGILPAYQSDPIEAELVRPPYASGSIDLREADSEDANSLDHRRVWLRGPKAPAGGITKTVLLRKERVKGHYDEEGTAIITDPETERTLEPFTFTVTEGQRVSSNFLDLVPHFEMEEPGMEEAGPPEDGQFEVVRWSLLQPDLQVGIPNDEDPSVFVGNPPAPDIDFATLTHVVPEEKEDGEGAWAVVNFDDDDGDAGSWGHGQTSLNSGNQ